LTFSESSDYSRFKGGAPYNITKYVRKEGDWDRGNGCSRLRKSLLTSVGRRGGVRPPAQLGRQTSGGNVIRIQSPSRTRAAFCGCEKGEKSSDDNSGIERVTGLDSLRPKGEAANAMQKKP